MVSAQDPSVSRITRESPYHHRNGHEERTGPAARLEEIRGSTRATHMEPSGSGPASRSAKSRGTYIPFSDCIDFDYNISFRELPARSNQRFMEQKQPHHEVVNEAQQENFVGRKGYRDFSSKMVCHERTEDVCASSTVVLGDRRARDYNSPLTLPLAKGVKYVNAVTETPKQASRMATVPPLLTDVEAGYSTAPNQPS